MYVYKIREILKHIPCGNLFYHLFPVFARARGLAGNRALRFRVRNILCVMFKAIADVVDILILCNENLLLFNMYKTVSALSQTRRNSCIHLFFAHYVKCNFLLVFFVRSYLKIYVSFCWEIRTIS